MAVYGDYTKYYLSIVVETAVAVERLDAFSNDLKAMRAQYKDIKLRTGSLQRGIQKWKKGITHQKGFLATQLAQAGTEERNRAITSYEATAVSAPSPDGFFAFLNKSKFFKVEAQSGYMVLAIGDLELLNKMTMSWKERYEGVGPSEWFPNPPPYLNSDVGYWVWQEMGAGPPQHWLKSTIQRYPGSYQMIGGNVPPRHILLKATQEAHHAQYTIAREVLARMATFNPWGNF